MSALPTLTSTQLPPLLRHAPQEDKWPASYKDVLNVLGGSLVSDRGQTIHYRIRGTDTLTWGSPFGWTSIRAVWQALSGEGLLDASFSAMQNIAQLESLEREIDRSASAAEYLRQIEVWAAAYKQEAIMMSDEEFDALIDDAYAEAMRLEH